jgi:xanthine dehydrogenase small subunit
MANSIRFVLNGKETEVAGLSPSTTVLDWLRGPAGLTGTKEGCAEGDCGACTIAIAEPRGAAPSWRAVNSCLMLVPQLDGCSVLTVEGLKGAGGALHPVQRALVEAHATQCGFCTPGFVMAMFAFHEGGEAATDANIHDALAGNLCRCTGYRPIVDAMRKLGRDKASLLASPEVLRVPPPPQPSPIEGEGENRAPQSTPSPSMGEGGAGRREVSPTNDASLRVTHDTGGEAYSHRRERFQAPRTIDELLALREKYPKAIVLGGGTDLGLLASKERAKFPAVISLARIEALRTVRDVEGGLEIGGAATYTDALAALDRRFPAFAAVVRRIGSRQIRNLGTFAGNLATASPIGDTLPCLIALDAKLQLVCRQGQRDRSVEEFIVGYRKTALRVDEVIRTIRVPFLAPGDRFFVYKISKRFDQDISAVIAAFRLRFDGDRIVDARLAFGGMADRPKRASAAEAALAGRPFDAEAVEAAAAALARDFAPITDFRASASYRLAVAANLLRRAHLQASAPHVPSEVAVL